MLQIVSIHFIYPKGGQVQEERALRVFLEFTSNLSVGGYLLIGLGLLVLFLLAILTIATARWTSEVAGEDQSRGSADTKDSVVSMKWPEDAGSDDDPPPAEGKFMRGAEVCGTHRFLFEADDFSHDDDILLLPLEEGRRLLIAIGDDDWFTAEVKTKEPSDETTRWRLTLRDGGTIRWERTILSDYAPEIRDRSWWGCDADGHNVLIVAGSHLTLIAEEVGE